MNIPNFATEHFFAKYEFNTPYQLCNSDCESMSVGELLAMADMSINQLENLGLGYTESQGNPALREAIARTYEHEHVTAEDIIVLGTPIEGIFLTAQAMLNPGDKVIVLAPAYDALINTFEHVVGVGNVDRWQFLPTERSWKLDLHILEALITPQTKMLVLNFPHNPTGFLPTPEQFEEIGELAEANNVLLFCDEMYRGLVLPGTRPIASAAELSPQSIVLSGLSKAHGLPGLRTGWLVVQDENMRAELMNWKFYTSICPPAPSELLALAGLQAQPKLIKRNVGIVSKNLALADAFFEDWESLFVWRRPQAGSTALVGLNMPSVTTFAEQLVEEAGILILPGLCLGADDQHFRLGLGRLAFEESLTKFDQYLRQQALI